jgi:peptide/nickel transport system ATP-binding protein
MIDVGDLTVRDRAGHAVVKDLSLVVPNGEALGIVGESGSGKTTAALAILGAIRPGLRLATGTVLVDGEPIFDLSERRRRALRRETLSYLGQDPAASLNPTMRIGAQLADPCTQRPSPEQILDRLKAVGLPADPALVRRFPHELSGGQQQRVALARALANDPRIVILDEPTTGLDVVTQDLVLSELARQRAQRGFALVVISHDLAVVARLADRLLVMRSGSVVDEGDCDELLARPSHPYTATLVAACPDLARARPRRDARAASGPPPIEVSGLGAGHPSRGGGPAIVAADDVSFSVLAGECLALVGASGSGKTTIARCLVGLHRSEAGVVRIAGAPAADQASRRPLAQRRAVQLVPQDPLDSLNPRRKAGASIQRPLRLLRGLGTAEAVAEVVRLLELVRLSPELADRHPRALSGGERQRVAIARALAAQPEVLVCDEITSALDVSVQEDVLAVLDDLRLKLGLAVVFISHDLGVVARVADRVLVLDQGVVREQGPLSMVLAKPSHETTKALVTASPSLAAVLEDRDAGRPGSADRQVDVGAHL